ncbi:MAG: dockerin type I repeat-containing protein, partial [Candidatus Zixiibacteriota bacterium]
IWGPSLDTFVMDYSYGANQVAFVDLELPETGDYAIFVSEDNGDQTDSYFLSLQCRRDVLAEADTIKYDTLLMDSVNPYGDMDAFIFSGISADLVTLRLMPMTNNNFNARLEIWGPSLDTFVMDYSYGANQVAFVDLELPETGDYAIFVSEDNGNQTDSYFLSLQCRRDVLAEAGLIGCDSLLDDSINPYGDIDAFVFCSDMGNLITLSVQPMTNNNFNARLEIWGPLLDTFVMDYSYGANQVAFVDLGLPETGNYAVFVSEDNGDQIDSYRLSLECYLCGDVNGNGSVNILDVTYLISYLYKGGPAPIHEKAADVNNSGGINLLDVTYLISYLYKGGPEPDCS